MALWDFKEAKGEKRKSLLGPFELSEMDGSIDRLPEGFLSGYSAKFGHGAYLALQNSQTGGFVNRQPKVDRQSLFLRECFQTIIK